MPQAPAQADAEPAQGAHGQPAPPPRRPAEGILAIYHQFRHLWRRAPAPSAAQPAPQQRGPAAAVPPPPLALWPLESLLLGHPVVYVNVGAVAAAA